MPKSDAKRVTKRRKRAPARRPAPDQSTDRSAKARLAIERVLTKRPDAAPAELRKVAARHDPSVEGLAPRSFHARYVLPTKRKLNPAKPRKKSGPAPARAKKGVGRPRRITPPPSVTEGQRFAVRQMVLARDSQVLTALSGDDAQAAYDLAARLDEYVEAIARALGK